jgi:hypothetical protein
MDGSTIAAGATIATIIGLIKSYVSVPLWVPAVLAVAFAAGVVVLGVMGGEIVGTPLQLATQVIEIALTAMGARAATQAGVQQATGSPLQFRSKGGQP